MYIKSILFLLLVGLGFSAQAQVVKFGHIDSQAFMEEMPEVANVSKVLDEEYKQLESKLTVMQEDLRKMQEDYLKIAESMSQADRSAKETGLMEANQKIQNFYTLSQQQLKSKEQELYLPIMKKVQAAIDEVGVENGFIYIFESSVGFTLYHSDKSIDIAPMVKTKLGMK